MSYFHLETDGVKESNQARNARLLAEYDAYVSQCIVDSVAPLNWVNWLASKKSNERIAMGKHPTERRNKPRE